MNRHVFLFGLLILFTYVVSAQIKTLVAKKEASSVTYRLVHPLHKIEATSKEAQFRLEADVATRHITRVSARVDVTSFDSGNSNRDSHAMEVIDAISYPEARLVSTSVTQSGDSVQVLGRLTFHGVTKDIAVGGTAKWRENRVSVSGGFEISLEGFGVERPSLLMIPVEDALNFSFEVEFGW